MSDLYESNVRQSWINVYILFHNSSQICPTIFFNANNFQILQYTWKKTFYSLFIKSNNNDFLQFIERCNKLGICLSQTSKIRILMILVATLMIYLQRVLNQVKAYVVLVTTATFLLYQVISVKVLQAKACIFLLQTSL